MCDLVLLFSSSSILCFLQGQPVAACFFFLVPLSLFLPSIMCFSRQLLHNIRPNELAFLHFIVGRMFLPFFTLCNTSFLIKMVQIYPSILLDTTLKTCKLSVIYFHNCPRFSILQTMHYWSLPYIICSYTRIWPYLVSVTDNEDFELSDRGLLDDNVSASVNTQENHCGTNKNHGKISHVSIPSTSLLIYYFVPSSKPLHSLPLSHSVIQRRGLWTGYLWSEGVEGAEISRRMESLKYLNYHH